MVPRVSVIEKFYCITVIDMLVVMYIYMYMMLLCLLLSRKDGNIIFDTLNLNTQANWYTDEPECKEVPVLCLQQLEKDTIFLGLERILTNIVYLMYVTCVVRANWVV